MKQAVIDIGSNSMRLSVYETTETGAFTILFKDKIMAGLAGYVEEGALSPEGITRGHPGSAVLPEHLACPEHPPGGGVCHGLPAKHPKHRPGGGGDPAGHRLCH